jgi:hypothetical protein
MIGYRHCEELLRRSNPDFFPPKLDCFASLAMTAEMSGSSMSIA